MFQILIYLRETLSFWEVWLKPFQRLVGAAAIGGRSSQRAKQSYGVFFCQAECRLRLLAERSEAVFILRQRCQKKSGCRAKNCFMEKGETRFSYRNCLSAFFFGRRGAKKKAWQKRNAYKGVSPLRRRPTLRALDRRELLKKLDQNFQQATAKHQFINYYV